MVMVFQSNSPKGLIHIHNQVENCIEVRIMEDLQEEDCVIKPHLKDCHLIHMEDCHLIHMLDFMDGRHPIQGDSCNHGIN